MSDDILTHGTGDRVCFIDLSATKSDEVVNTAFSAEKKGRDTSLPSVVGKEKASMRILEID